MPAKPRSNRLGMYSDVREILDAALASGGGEYQLATYNAAIHWRQRAYKFRKLFATMLGEHKESPYDSVIIRRPTESGLLILDVRRVEGEFKPTGNAPPVLSMDDDDLLDIASGLAEKIEKGVD